MKEKHYLVYQITNLINEKIYIGIHTTTNLEDGYFGSSVLLKNALRKYGVENFKKEILFDFDNPEDMIAKERELVNDSFVSRKDTYNLNIGGGSFYYINSSGKSNPNTANKKHLDNLKNPEYKAAYSLKVSEGVLKNNGTGFLGKRHTEESKRKMSEKNKVILSGSGNSQYGTCWIHKGEQVIKIKKESLETYLEQGWIRGRKK